MCLMSSKIQKQKKKKSETVKSVSEFEWITHRYITLFCQLKEYVESSGKRHGIDFFFRPMSTNLTNSHSEFDWLVTNLMRLTCLKSLYRHQFQRSNCIDFFFILFFRVWYRMGELLHTNISWRRFYCSI